MSRRPPAPPESQLRRLYGMGAIDWLNLAEHQGWACPPCGRSFTMKRRPCVDHDHRTGLVRGLLCPGCNLALGYLHEDVGWLTRAATYLSHPPAEACFDTRPRDPNAPPEA